MRFVACIPTYFRPEGLRRVLKSIKDQAPFMDVSVAVEPSDLEAVRICQEFGAICTVCKEPDQGDVYAWNTAFASVCNDYDIFIVLADDTYIMPGCIEEAAKYILEYGLVGFNDNDIRELEIDNGRVVIKQDYATHYMMTRDHIIQYQGGCLMVPHYAGWYPDKEAAERAKRVKQYIKIERANMKHDWQGSATDNHYKEMKALYEKREKAGFPDDFEPIVCAL
jgi:glycosyltransferase involved in cell wall biosynthesis